MEKPLHCIIKNSELAVSKEKLDFLTYRAEGLCSCSLEKLEDGIKLCFETNEMEPASIIAKKSRADKLRFLINVAELEKLHADYIFSMSPDNLMVDVNLRTWVLKRDLNPGADEFLSKYKALIGHILGRKYTYADYLSGSDLYRKNKLVKTLADLDSVCKIRNRLLEEYKSEVRGIETTKRIVSKTHVRLLHILLPIITVALAAVVYFAFRAYYDEMPYKDSIIAASQAYINGDYLTTQQVLADIEIDDMTYETQHLLSRAYVSTEPLTAAQKENVLMGLTRITDSAIFAYWIHLGRLDFDSAVEIAQRYGDTELLLFAYLKQEAYVRADTTIPGNEKVELLKFLEDQITKLEAERTVEDEQ